MKRNFTKPITATVDDLLKHAMSIDPNEVEEHLHEDRISEQEAIDMIVDRDGCSEEDALELISQIRREEFRRVCTSLVEKGVFVQEGYDDEGEPKYKVTALGRKEHARQKGF